MSEPQDMRRFFLGIEALLRHFVPEHHSDRLAVMFTLKETDTGFESQVWSFSDYTEEITSLSDLKRFVIDRIDDKSG